MAGFRERAEAELKGTTVEAVQAQASAKNNTSFRERAQAELSKSSQQANTAYRSQQRRQKSYEQKQQQKQRASGVSPYTKTQVTLATSPLAHENTQKLTANMTKKYTMAQDAVTERQKKYQSDQWQQTYADMNKRGKSTTAERVDAGESESDIGKGWENRADLDKLWGTEYNTTAYQKKADKALAKLDDTSPDTANMNDATRYEQMQEARQKANKANSVDTGKQEAFDTAKWEETQRLGIQGASDPQLVQNLQQLNKLYTTANMGHESVAEGAQKQYDTLYDQLKEQYGDRVDDWVEYVKRLENAQSMGEMTQRIADVANESPVVASLATPIVNAASGAGILDVGAQRLGNLISGSDTPIDYNRAAQLPSKWVTTTRGTVSGKIAKDTDGWIGSNTPVGNLYSGLYNIGMSMADSIVGQKLGGATVFMGGAAATNAMNEARERGASADQALAYGLLAGAAETVMEKVPMDKLLTQENPANVRSAVKNILSQSASEASEEALTTLANTVSDAIIMGDKSELNTAIRAYRANGYSEEDAQKKAFTDWLIGLAGDAIGGAVSGGLFAAAYNIPGGIEYNRSNTDFNADTSVEQNSNAEIDPLEFAIQETMKPTKEQQAFDQAMEDTANWMLGKEKTATAEAGTESTKVNTDPTKHTRAEQTVIDEYQAAVDPNLVDYYNEVDNGNAKGFYPLKPVNERAAADIQAITGNDVTGYQTRFDARQMYHVKDDHGPNGKANRSMSDSNDVGRVQYVLDNYDSVDPGGITDAYWETKPNGHNRRAQTVVFKKKVNGTYYVVEAAPVTKAKSLYVVSTYMDGTKKAEAVPHLLDAEASQSRPKTSNAYHASDDFTIPNSNQNVNQNRETNFDNDMGAKKPDFEHEVKQSKSKTTPDFYEKHNVPDGSRTTNEYTAVTEAESLHNAKMRLEQDYGGEMMELRSKPVWTNKEVDMGQMILEDLWYESTEIGDDSAFRDWDKVVKQHKQEIPRALQALAKWNRNSGARIVSAAIDILDGKTIKKNTDTNAVMSKVSEDAKRFDAARINKDVDGLVQLIKDTAAERNTGYRIRKDGTQKQSEYLNWALNRIAKYAKSGELTGDVDADLQINAANIQDPDVAFKFLQDFASTGILNIAADTQKVSKGTQLMSLRRSGMLSKLSTTMRNLVSNGSFNVVDTIARDISVPLDMLVSNFTGTRSTSVDYGYLSKAARQGSLDNIAIASLETSLDVNSRDTSGKYIAGGQRTFKMSGNAVERFLSRLESLQGYEMYVTDEMSKGRTQGEVQIGVDKLYEQGKIKADDNSLRDAGTQTGLYRTFQDETALSNATLKTRDALNEIHAGEIGLGDVLMTFAQVPANLADRAIDYSPAGLAKTTGKLVEALSKAKKGEFTAADQARVVQSLGRNITGTAMVGIAAALAANGLIRVENPGDEDENKDKTAFEKMQGQTGTQWNLSATMRKLKGEDPTWQDGDDLMSIAFLEPINANLTIGALLAEDMELGGQLTAKQALKDSFTGSLTAIMDLPMMDTIGNAMDAYKYSSENRTGDKLWDAAGTLVAEEAASLIPNWMKGIRQGIDPYQRDLYTEDGTWEQLKDQYQAVFRDRSKLPVKQDSFGRDMMNEGGAKNFLNTNILPGYMTTYKTDATMDEIASIAEATEDNSIYPSRKAPDELSVDGEKVALSSEEQKQYQKIYGNTDEAVRTGLRESEAYQGLSVEEKAKAHKYSEEYAKQVAASQINGDYDTDNWVEELQGKSEAEIVEAVLLKTFESIANSKNYSSKYDGMSDLVEQDKLSDAMAITMMPDKMQTAYQDVAKTGGVSVDEWLDMYAYAYPNGKTETGGTSNEKIREAALEYIGKQSWGEVKKTAAASAVYQYLTDTVPLERDVPYAWALGQGDSGLTLVESGMGKTQKENYEKYVKGHLDNDKMKLYLDAYAYKGTAKSDKDADGNTVVSAKSKVIEYIDSLDLTNHEKIRIFLGLDYAKSGIPYWWMY